MNAFFSNLLLYFPHVRESSSGGSRGGAQKTCPPYFSTKMRPEGSKKNFLETAPTSISESGWPPLAPYLKVWIRHCPGHSGILDSSPDSVFQVLDTNLFQWNLDSGFQKFVGFRIPWALLIFPIPKSRVPDSKIFSDFGFRKQNFSGFRNSDSITWSEVKVE